MLFGPKLADLYVVLAVQNPGGEFCFGGAWYAPQPLGVEGQTHDGLRVGFDLAQLGPLGYVPQQQGTILVSSQQERSGTRVWLEEKEGDKSEEGWGEHGKLRCGVAALQSDEENPCAAGNWEGQRLSSWKLPLTLREAAGSIRQPVAVSLLYAITTLLTLLLIYIPGPKTS